MQRQSPLIYWSSSRAHPGSTRAISKRLRQLRSCAGHAWFVVRGRYLLRRGGGLRSISKRVLGRPGGRIQRIQLLCLGCRLRWHRGGHGVVRRWILLLRFCRHLGCRRRAWCSLSLFVRWSRRIERDHLLHRGWRPRCPFCWLKRLVSVACRSFPSSASIGFVEFEIELWLV